MIEVGIDEAKVLLSDLIAKAEAGETRGYDVAAHVAALRRHGVEPDVVVAQRGGLARGADLGVEVVEADVVRPHGLAHDPALLGPVLAGLCP